MDLKIAMTLLFQIVVGILGNFSLIIHYIMPHFRGCRSRSTDSILKHLTVANSLAILSIGIPQTLLAFGLKHFLNDSGCKLVLYLQRVARGMSICTTCLLSVFQTITISPIHSRWAEIKLKALKYIGPSNILCWILHMLVNTIFPVYASDKWSNNSIIKKNVLEYCSTVQNYSITFSLYAALISSHDVVCLGFMSWASGFMVFILYRHKKQVQHIHRNVSPRSSAETRANQTILVLVSTFVSFYALSSIIYAYLVLFNNPSWLVNTSALVSACFPTVSPFVLMSSDPCAKSNSSTVHTCNGFQTSKTGNVPDLRRRAAPPCPRPSSAFRAQAWPASSPRPLPLGPAWAPPYAFASVLVARLRSLRWTQKRVVWSHSEGSRRGRETFRALVAPPRQFRCKIVARRVQPQPFCPRAVQTPPVAVAPGGQRGPLVLSWSWDSETPPLS
ncbi:LOW QUALITY PROTEIN: vomeronasal type-1 receptor 4-like [Dugong dugon]